MKAIKRHSVKLYLALAVAGLVTLWLWPALVAAMPLTAQHHLERAWQLAADMSQYDYQSTVLRTKHPTLTLGNVGRTATTERFVIEGQLDRPTDLMTMNIAAPNQPPLEVKLEQGRAYGRMDGVDGLEKWTEVEVGSDLFAPGGDPLAFLNIVENVRRIDQNGNRTIADNEPNELFPAEMLPASLVNSISRYQFDVSGPKYARQMRTSLEQALHERGELPLPAVPVDERQQALLGDQVDLVQRRHDGNAGPLDQPQHVAVPGPGPDRRIEHEHEHVDVAEGVEREVDHPRVHAVQGAVNPGGIDEHHLAGALAGDVPDADDAIPRRLRLVRHDGQLGADEQIQQRRLASVGTADERREPGLHHRAAALADAGRRRIRTRWMRRSSPSRISTSTRSTTRVSPTRVTRPRRASR